MEINTPLILNLLKAELKNAKLIHGLLAAGALVEDFNSDLVTDILKLIGFTDEERDDPLYELYFLTLERFTKQDTPEFLE